MIAREWKCRCPRKHRDGFLKHLYETGVKDTRATNGFKGAQILERDLGDAVELTLITFWDSLKHIALYAGDDIETARLYPGDEQFDLDPDSNVTHYSVVENSFT